MRVVVMLLMLVVFTPSFAQAQVSEEPIGNLAELMRGIMFPNSNKLFDLQSVEPGTELPEMSDEASEAVSAVMGPASARFAAVYRGWQDVAGAAVALADGAKLAMLEGRLCENGMPAPVDQADYIEAATLLEESAVKVLDAVRMEDYEEASFAVNFIVESCSNCHSPYRDGPDSRQEPRCNPSE